MEVIITLLGLGLVAAAPSIPGLRSVAKVAVKTGMSVTETTVAVATIVSEQVNDRLIHSHTRHTITEVDQGIPSWLDDTDLLLIDGIGPKVSGHLTRAGVSSISQLAVTPLTRLQEILDAAGPNFGAIDSTTWPEQAQALLAGVPA